MLRNIALLMMATLLSGCAAAGVVIYDGSKKSNRPLVVQTMAEARPDLPSEAAADCVIKVMTIRETIALGTSDTTRLTSAARQTILGYAAREKAVACLASLPKTGAA